MKVNLIWVTVLGMMLVKMVGCGNTDDPIREMPKPLSERQGPSDSRVLGDWLLQEAIWLKNGVETQRIDYSPFSFSLGLMPDSYFFATYKFPIEYLETQRLLESNGWEHLQDQDIVVAFRGKYQTNNNQLRLNLTSASAKPKEAREIDRDFEEPGFIYYLGEPDLLYYSFSDDGNQLQMKREFLTPEGDNHTVIFPHHRLKGK